MSSCKVNARVAPVKLRQAFDEQEQGIINYLAHMTSPVSIDALTTLSGASFVDTLNLMDRLLKKKAVSEKKGYKRGIYFFDDASLKILPKGHPSEDETRKIIKKIIDFYAQSLNESGEKILILANLYRKLPNNGEGLACIKSAADALYAYGEREKVVAYYDHILENFSKNPPTEGNVDVFLDVVLKKMSIMTFPSYSKASFLTTAEKIAKKYMKWNSLARIEYGVIVAFVRAGQFRKAFQYYDAFRKLATKTGNPHLLRMVPLLMALPYFYKGVISKTIHCYEEGIGKQEEFENDEEALRLGTLVGWCYVICGRISRGMGMIDTSINRRQEVGNGLGATRRRTFFHVPLK